MFTKFGRGRLNSDGDRRGSLCGGWENFAIFDIIARYIFFLREESDDAYWASEPDRMLKFSTFKNPRWRSLTDEHLTEQH